MEWVYQVTETSLLSQPTLYAIYLRKRLRVNNTDSATKNVLSPRRPIQNTSLPDAPKKFMLPGAASVLEIKIIQAVKCAQFLSPRGRVTVHTFSRYRISNNEAYPCPTKTRPTLMSFLIASIPSIKN